MLGKVLLLLLNISTATALVLESYNQGTLCISEVLSNTVEPTPFSGMMGGVLAVPDFINIIGIGCRWRCN